MSTDTQNALETILAQLQAPIEQWYKGDPLAYMELMADDVTYFAPNTEARVEGKSAVEALYNTFKGMVHVPAFKILNPELQLGEDVGIFTYHLTEYDSDGMVMVRWNATEAYQRKGDQWQMIHAHWSMIGETQ